jgi:hypothetical protein
MRLWSVHPHYLDRQGLCGLWREALLAQKVLKGETRGYLRHPQLARFRTATAPLAAIAAYLQAVQEEGSRRGYRFDASKIGPCTATEPLPVRRGQLLFEWQHLKTKLAERDPARLDDLSSLEEPQAHPLFVVVAGGMEEWEKGAG